MSWHLTEEQEALRARARALAAEVVAPRAAEVDRTEEYPWDVVEALRDAGFTGMTVPAGYGGPGHSFLDAVLVVEEMARACGVTGRIAVEANMGAISAVMAYGTDAQRRLAAGMVLDGDKPAICITEPEAGSAASQMTTRADRRGDSFVLNGGKHWITGGGVSRLHLVFARVFDEDGTEEGIGGFLAVRGENPGLVVGRREPTMGLRGIPETEILLRDMVVGPDMVLVPPSGFGRGFAELMNAYNSQRVGAGTVALGLAAGAHDRAVSFVKDREQFGRPVGSFQAVQHLLADLPGLVDGAHLLTAKAAWAGDRATAGIAGVLDVDANDVTDFEALAAMALLTAGEAAALATDRSLHVHGGYGFSEEYDIQLYYRRARALSYLLDDPARESRRLAGMFLGATELPEAVG